MWKEKGHIKKMVISVFFIVEWYNMVVIVLRYLFVGEFRICFFEILMNEGFRKNSMLLWLEKKLEAI